jgi:hypothetical protein
MITVGHNTETNGHKQRQYTFFTVTYENHVYVTRVQGKQRIAGQQQLGQKTHEVANCLQSKLTDKDYLRTAAALLAETLTVQ